MVLILNLFEANKIGVEKIRDIDASGRSLIAAYPREGTGGVVYCNHGRKHGNTLSTE
jgi:hypothetical protein